MPRAVLDCLMTHHNELKGKLTIDQAIKHLKERDVEYTYD